uniref:Uncharacterized protein n=1 Tax=Oryza sativa subsp. japonica TaxID=39947 RepID=Q75LG1_ORYSJ|nr:hypothetical protein [Oryza sativa Japonica Group]
MTTVESHNTSCLPSGRFHAVGVEDTTESSASMLDPAVESVTTMEWQPSASGKRHAGLTVAIESIDKWWAPMMRRDAKCGDTMIS